MLLRTRRLERDAKGGTAAAWFSFRLGRGRGQLMGESITRSLLFVRAFGRTGAWAANRSAPFRDR